MQRLCLARVLLRRKARSDVIAKHGNTPRALAEARKQESVVKLLKNGPGYQGVS